MEDVFFGRWLVNNSQHCYRHWRERKSLLDMIAGKRLAPLLP